VWTRRLVGLGLAICAAAVVVTLVAGSFGLLSLGLVGVAVLPVGAASVLGSGRPACELSPIAATELYADALAAALGVARQERRYIPAIIREASEIRRSGALEELEAHALDPRDLKEASRCWSKPAHAAWTLSEWWNGSGPTGARAPLIARIIAAAEAWSALTAQGGPTLSHEEALNELQRWAGTRYDPMVIDAAAVIVRRERRVSSEPAFQPRLHRLWSLPGGLAAGDGSFVSHA
jgi:hypothetical protein